MDATINGASKAHIACGQGLHTGELDLDLGRRIDVGAGTDDRVAAGDREQSAVAAADEREVDKIYIGVRTCVW